MDLWIRNQNKEQLIKVDSRLYIYDWNIGENSYSVSTDIIKYGISNLVLGYYNSKERALEILDEIQNILNPKYMIRMDGNLNNVEKFLNIDGAYIKSQDNADIKIINNSYVYEMPKE